MNEKKRRRLQELFDQFNEGGSWMRVDFRDGCEPVQMGLQDSYRVTRVDENSFWLMHRPVGYHSESHYTHTHRIVEWSQEDTYLLDLVTDSGLHFHIELLMPVVKVEADMLEDWKRWRSYKADNREMFDKIDADLLATHVEMAENWK